MKILFNLLFFINLTFAEVCTNDIENLDICFSQSIQQSFYMFNNIYIDNFEVDSGSLDPNDNTSCPDKDCDVIAAFYNDICVGWTYPFKNPPSEEGYFTIPIMMQGNDELTSNYIPSGQIPELRLYDTSTNTFYSTTSEPALVPINNNQIEVLSSLYSSNIILSSENTLFPSEYNITEVYPNPFNSNTKISYSIPELTNLKISVHNVLGQKIITLVDDIHQPGFHNINWDAGDISSGFYLVKLDAEFGSISKKVLLVK